MIITAVNEENLLYFQNFLLPETAEQLRNRNPVTVLGLVQGSTACGAAAGYLDNDVFYLLSLFVAPEYRRKGGGTLLLDTLLEALRTIPDLYYMQADYTITENDHLSLEPFLKKNGFCFQEKQNSYYSVTLGSLSESGFFANLSEVAGFPEGILPFSHIPEIYQNLLKRSLTAEESGPTEDPSGDAAIDSELSLGVVEDGKITAYVLFNHSFAGRLTLAYAGSEPGGRASALFPVLLRCAFRLAGKRFSPETEVVFQTVTPESARLAKKLLEAAGGGECLSKACFLPLLDYSQYGGLFA